MAVGAGMMIVPFVAVAVACMVGVSSGVRGIDGCWTAAEGGGRLLWRSGR